MTLGNSRLDEPPTRDAVQPPVQGFRKTGPAAIIGTVVEYYDFGIYGYMAAILGAQFFVAENDTAALLGTFAAFAVAFFLRIPGGIFFGHIGDRFGRRKALTWTIFLMVTATALMGVLPNYATLGIWATTLMVLCRCLQGFAAGGELSGANVLVTEAAPARHRALQTSLVSAGPYLGSLLASLAGLGASALFSPEQLHDWAWRLPFLVSVPLGLIGFWVRANLDETPVFKELATENEVQDSPVKVLVGRSFPTVLTVAGICGLITGGYYLATVYSASFLQTTAGQSPAVAFLSTTIALVLGVATLPLGGGLSDRIGRKPVLFISSGVAMAIGIPAFVMMSSGNMVLAVMGQSILFMSVALCNGAAFTTFAELFPSTVRYSGIAMGNNLALTLLGGTAPFIAVALVTWTGNALAPGGFFVACAALTFISTFRIKETRGAAL